MNTKLQHKIRLLGLLLLVVALVLPPAQPGQAAPSARFAASAGFGAPARFGAADFDCSTVSEIPQSECQALLAINNAVGGTSTWSYALWLHEENENDWLSTNTPCTWIALTCTGGHITEIRMTGLQLTVLPPEILDLTYLTTLHLGSFYDIDGDYNYINRLTSLPAGIGSLTGLTLLDLDYNLLTSLPAEIGNLTQLEMLDLDYNHLASLPPEIGSMTGLTTLDLKSNQITSLPPVIGNLAQLTVLNLSFNALADLPPEIGSLTGLRELDLSGNRFSSLPLEIIPLSQLRVLGLAHQLIASLPPEIGNLTELTELDLGVTSLRSLPPEIGNLTQLKILLLGGSGLTSLPPEIGSLTQLEMLDLDYNHLTSLPPEIGNLVNLQDISLRKNPISSLPPEFGNLTNLLPDLDLSDMALTSLPPEIGNLTQLTALNLDLNYLTSLPPEIGKLTGLKGLTLQRNRLTSLPPEISKLTGLEGLNLSHNCFDSLLPEIGSLTGLEYLPLNGNRLTSLPDSIMALQNLTGINLDYNRLAIQDADLVSFLNLRAVGLGNLLVSQTVAPVDLRVTEVYSDGFELSWTPIQYTGDGGEYEISHAIDPSGPFTVLGSTPDKLAGSFQAHSLPASGVHYFRLRTHTPDHTVYVFNPTSDDNLNDLWSDYSQLAVLDAAQPVSVTIQPTSSLTLNYYSPQGELVRLYIPSGAVTETIDLEYSSGYTQGLSTSIAASRPIGATPPPTITLLGTIFELRVLRDGQPVNGFTFQSPVILGVSYDQAAAAGLLFRLSTWKDGAWISAACSSYQQTLPPDGFLSPIPLCQPGRFAVTGQPPAATMYLPLVKKLAW